jgi:hypothetical protein
MYPDQHDSERSAENRIPLRREARDLSPRESRDFRDSREPRESRVEKNQPYAYVPEQRTNMEIPPKKQKKTWLKVLVILIILAVLGAGAFYYYKQGKFGHISISTKAIAPSDVVAMVGKLMVLPTDEQPTVATVTDLEKLKGQPFFTNAKVGNYVLIYVKSKKAILFDGTANKIIEVGALNADAAAAGTNSKTSTNTNAASSAKTTTQKTPVKTPIKSR